MVDEYGSSPALDEDLDFSVGPTGDLAITSGLSELEKDLSIRMIIGLSKYIGQPPSGNLQEKIVGTATAIAESDVRVASVRQDKTKAEFGPNREEINLNMTVQTTNGEQELIFEI